MTKMTADLLATSIGKMWPVLILAAGAGGTIWQVNDMAVSVEKMVTHQEAPGHAVAMEKMDTIASTVKENRDMLKDHDRKLVALCVAVGADC